MRRHSVGCERPSQVHPILLIKKLPPPTPIGVKGGCSPQNNRGNLRGSLYQILSFNGEFCNNPDASTTHRKKVSNTDASRVYLETRACVGFTVSNLLTIVYRRLTRCPLSRMSAT
jgi:hypothetical protein